MTRLLTAAVALPLAVAAVFLLSPRGFFVLLLAIVELEVLEFVRLSRWWAPSAPRAALLVLVPAAALLMSPAVVTGAVEPISWEYLLAAAGALSVGIGLLVLLGGTEAQESMSGLGVLGFGVVYFALPIACLYYLRRLDPWLVILLCAIVWLGDTAAYYCGTVWGRHKLFERVSPKKTWEGALGSFATALAAAAIWSQWHVGEVRPAILLLAAVTSVGAQCGDLLESLFKRGAGVKDSGGLLPGHGGMLDRMDAMMFAAPVLVLGIWLLGLEAIAP